jgi:putative lipoic acid-binding regulatory protein
MSQPDHIPASPHIPPEQSLIEYPCAFPIKVMGPHNEAFVDAVVAIVRELDPTFDATTIQRRPSSSGNYLGLTVTVTATSRIQLDNIYRSLTSHPMVKYVL